MRRDEPDDDVHRLSALSDGVMAIAMTLLVLDLDKPNPANIHSIAELHQELAQWSAYLSFALSFGVIALYWVAHFSTFRRLRSVDGTIVWLNVAFLMGITFIPFPTAVLNRFSDDRLPVILYAGTLAAVGIVWTALWRHAMTQGLLFGTENDPSKLWESLDAPIVFLASMVIALFSPGWAMRSWLLIVVAGRVRAFAVARSDKRETAA